MILAQSWDNAGRMAWDEVRSHGPKNTLGLSNAQRQRFCIARAATLSPDVLLMNGFCSMLDPIFIAEIEDLIGELKSKYTVVVVTRKIQQVARVSQWIAFGCIGEIPEHNGNQGLWVSPKDKRTEDSITGRFG